MRPEVAREGRPGPGGDRFAEFNTDFHTAFNTVVKPKSTEVKPEAQVRDQNEEPMPKRDSMHTEQPTSFHKAFTSRLAARFPEVAKAFDLTTITPNLLSPHVIEIPGNILDEARSIVAAFSALRAIESRGSRLSALAPTVVDPGNHSILMSYDFHIDSSGQLRLIEINTNASMSLMTTLLYETHGIADPLSQKFATEIINCFEAEFDLAFAEQERQLQTIAIVDEAPEKQRLFIEFLMYQELFRSRNYDVVICDSSELRFGEGELWYRNRKIDLVYNRHTDFYFETPETSALRQAMESRSACITPHPHEYRLLADKERLMELSRPAAIEELPLDLHHRQALNKTLIPALEISEFKNPDELWNDRKKWFFKPKRSYGGKAAYRGSSMSRPIFAQILQGSYMAQEFIPAPTIELPSGDGTDLFKYDLRFFAYRDEVQLAAARLYKGQMTNASTPGGGVAAIRWLN